MQLHPEMSLHDPERAYAPHDQVGPHAGWAMAVGGMIGGGVFTLAGLILAHAGTLAWVSLGIGGAIALATVRSYGRLTAASATDAVPMSLFVVDGRRRLASATAWGLLVVYVLALAVYTFTVGHYLGAALDLAPGGVVACEVAITGGLVLLNLRRIGHSTTAQIVIVWLELAILLALAVIGIAQLDFAKVERGVPAPSLGGVVGAAALTFVAFEGFEMLAYDVRELQRPRRILRTQLPWAVIAVAVAYALVTLGAASLVGSDVLVEHEDHALGVAGEAAAGKAGVVVVTIAAFAAGGSAINATLFSVARLARTAAERGLLPWWCASCNSHDAPHWAVIAIGVASVVIAAVARLEPLVAVTSLGFLALFSLVNVLAWRRLVAGRWVAGAGAVAASVCTVVLAIDLARDLVGR